MQTKVKVNYTHNKTSKWKKKQIQVSCNQLIGTKGFPKHKQIEAISTIGTRRFHKLGLPPDLLLLIISIDNN